MLSKSFKIISESGLHARPATILVNEAVGFKCEIDLQVDSKSVNLKSIMGVMSLGVFSGEVIEIVCNGEDEVQAMNKITDALINMKLGKEI